MTPEQIVLLSSLPDGVSSSVWQAVSERWEFPPLPATSSGQAFAEACLAARLSFDQILLALSSYPGSEVSLAIRHLLQKDKNQKPKLPPRMNALRRRDPRKIHILATSNPKKAGTRAYHLFTLYREGMSVDEYILAGGRASAVRYDSQRGFIRVL